MAKIEITKVPRGGSVYDEEGKQYCDPTPVEMPLGYQVPESLESMISRMCTDRMMQMELARQNGGQDTEEEADDFEIDGSEDLDFIKSGFQMDDMQEEYVDLKKLREDSEAHAEREINARMEEERRGKEKQKAKRVRKAREDAESEVEEGGAQ